MSAQLIDIGINLAHDSFDNDRADVIRRADAAGVTHMVITGSSLASTRAVIELVRTDPQRFRCTAGVHPHHAAELDDAAFRELATLGAAPEVVAVGECGLDYFRNLSPRPAQVAAFRRQLELAVELRKPVFLHQRDAHDEFLAILREYGSRLAGGVAHCFTAGIDEARAYLDLGLFIGITGWITDERRGLHLREVVRTIPAERLLIETDGPYLLPRDLEPKPQSRRNEPMYLPHVLRAIAAARGQSPQELASLTTRNAHTLFGWPAPAAGGFEMNSGMNPGMNPGMNIERLTRYIDTTWDQSIVPALSEYIRIPNKSVHFDPQWEQHGHMQRAAELMKSWCEKHALPGMKIEIVRLPGLTPLLYIEVPASGGAAARSNDCVLLYGHMDKQPEFSGWAEGLDPWKPVLRDGRLYGRGGADDGYAVFGSLLALRALADQNIPYARSVILIEGSEESGSPDLPAYIDALADRIGEPSLVVCLDAECGNYDQFWCTTSLRGNLVGTLRVAVLNEGVHSGMASGIVPSSFRIARRQLERVENAETGKLIDALWTKIPEDRLQQARAAARALGKGVYTKLPFAGGTHPINDDPYELLLNSNWRPTLSVTGAEGLPSLQNAGNVLRPSTTLKLSFRLPPGVDAEAAANAVKQALESDPPYGATVTFEVESSMGGWNAPSTAPWLEAAIQSASHAFFGRDAMYMGVGGTIPFMGMLSEKFPRTQFLITGVLGPHSNAHGPNEFLDIATGKRVTACVAHVVAEHAKLK